MLFHSKLECGALGPEFHRETPPERNLCVLYVFPDLQGEMRFCVRLLNSLWVGKAAFASLGLTLPFLEPSFTGGRGAHRCHVLTSCFGSQNWYHWLLSMWAHVSKEIHSMLPRTG